MPSRWSPAKGFAVCVTEAASSAAGVLGCWARAVMGLPVTASYIVLATLAGPALLSMGVPLMIAHMIVFFRNSRYIVKSIREFLSNFIKKRKK